MTTPQEPWTHILNALAFKDQDCLVISANDMKKCKKTWTGKANQFEPRLLAYHTSAEARPECFKQNGLYLLPIKNGTYLLTRKNIYYPLQYLTSDPVLVPRAKDSLVLQVGNSETSLIDNLRYSGVFERPEILGEKILFGPLLNGRHRCKFDMTLHGDQISVAGVQYEVDACFETEKKILLIEGKSNSKMIESFNIRQLYYPYREIKSKIGDKKQILCAFLTEFKGIVNIWLFDFSNEKAMESIQLRGQYRYKFSS
jgi:hypothetical protein